MLELAQAHGFHFDAAQMPLNILDAQFRSFAHLSTVERGELKTLLAKTREGGAFGKIRGVQDDQPAGRDGAQSAVDGMRGKPKLARP
jgi:hypothetical protein